MVWGAKMPLKINQKSNEILDAFSKSFWRKSVGGGDSPHGAWNLNLP